MKINICWYGLLWLGFDSL